MPELAHIPRETLAPLEALIPERYNENMADVATSIYLRLVEDEDLAGLGLPRLAALAMVLTEGLANDLGGRNFYMAKGTYFRLSLRDREIVAEFNGRNKRELGKKHNLCDMRIDQILNAWRQEEFKRRQGTLDLEPALD